MNAEPQPGEVWVTDHGVRMKMPRADASFSYVRLDYRLMGRRFEPTFSNDWQVAWAEAWRVDALIAAEQGDTSGLTVTALAAAWQQAQRTEWSDRYEEDNERTVANDVLPHIGAVRLGELTRAHARDCINAQQSSSGRKRVRALLSSMYGWGIDEQWVTSDLRNILPPVGKDSKGVKLRYVRRETVPAPEDVLRLAHQVTMPRAYESKHARKSHTPPWWQPLMFLLAGYCGMREGEVFALRGKHINDDVLLVRQQVQFTKGQFRFTPPKYNSVRDVYLPAMAGDFQLRAMLARRANEVGAEGLLFPTPSGNPWRRNNFVRDVVNYPRALVWPGKTWTFHDMRHTACRRWLDDGLAIADVSRLAGHSGVDVTMKLYISQTEGVNDRARALYG